MPGQVVVLVGGPDTGKSKFYTYFTQGYYTYPTTRVKSGITIRTPSFVIVDTPGNSNHRNRYEYSWDGIFTMADIILDFGGWSESEIHGNKTRSVHYMTYSGDNDETMKRIQEYLQGKQ